MAEQSIAALTQARQTQFIETRTIIETEMNKHLQSLEQLSPEIQQQLNVRHGITCKDLLPELWHEPFDIDTYEQQLSGVEQYLSQIKAFQDAKNAEAWACLQSQ